MSTPFVRHFLVWHRVEYDLNDPVNPYTLWHLVFQYRPPDESGYPFLLPDLWLFTLLVGDGVEEMWVELVFLGPLDPDPGEEPEPEEVAVYGPFVTRFGPETVTLARGWHIRAVPFDRPGWYEFRLLHQGVVLAEELVQMED